MAKQLNLIVAFLFVLCSQVGLQRAASQEELLTEAPDKYRAYGTVVNEQGSAVENGRVALVMVPQFKPLSLLNDPCLLGSCTTDDSGTFDLRIEGDDPCWSKVNERTKILLLVLVDGCEIESKEMDRERLLVDLPFAFNVSESESMAIRVLDEKSQPLADYRLSPAKLSQSEIPFRNEFFEPVTTNDNGVAKLSGFSAASLKAVYASGASGNFRLAVVQEGEQYTAKIPPTGVVRGKFEFPDDIKANVLEGEKVFVTSGNLYQRNVETSSEFSWHILPLDSESKFETSGMVFGFVLMMPVNLNSLNYSPSSAGLSPILNAENSPLDVSQKMAPVKEYFVRFLDEEGNPANSIFTDSIGQTGVALNSDDTKPASGILALRFADGQKPSGQLFPYDSTGRLQVVDPFGILLDRREFKDSEPEEIQLVRSRSIQGRVVDDTGQPVEGAKVSYQFGSERFTMTKEVYANKSGNFRINGLAPDTVVSISASKGDMMTPKSERASVTSGSADGIDVVVIRQPSAAIQGKVVDAVGNPVPDATVEISKIETTIEEGFSAEDVRATGSLISDLQHVAADENGGFRFPATTQFNERFQISISAPGCRTQRFPFINGALKQVNDKAIDVGELQLVRVPNSVKTVVSVTDARSGNPVSDATIVFLGIDSKKVTATSDQQGRCESLIDDTRQMIAIKAQGYQLKLNLLTSANKKIDVQLDPTETKSENLSWLDKPWTDYNKAAKSVLKQLNVPSPGESTFYRQSAFFTEQLKADFASFKSDLLSRVDEYENAVYLFLFNPGIAFLSHPDAAVDYVMSTPNSLSIDQKASMMSSFALHAQDAELKDELYGEAILLLGGCGEDSRRASAGQIATMLVIDGRIDIAKEIIQREWDSAVDLRQQLESGTKKPRIVDSRVFLPPLAMISLSDAVELIRLTASENEMPGLINQCLAYASIADHPDVESVCEKENLEFDASGLNDEIGSLADCRSEFPVARQWFQDHIDRMPDSVGKAAAIMFVARQLKPGSDRDALLNQIAELRESCLVSYLYNDPARLVLQELPKFESFSVDVFDRILFASIRYAPDRPETMQMNQVFANMLKLLAVRDPDIARAMLDQAFSGGAWLHGDPDWSAFKDNELLKAYAWVDPDVAIDKANELADRYEADDPVRRLQLLISVASELNAIAIRKGMFDKRR